MNDTSTKPLTDLQAAKQARVIATTQRLLSMRTVEDIRVEEIAAASRVAIGSLYKRFGTKDGLIAAALVDYFDGAVHALIAGRHRVPLQALLSGLDATVERILKEPDFARALMSAYFRAGHQSAALDGLTRRVIETYLPMLNAMRRRSEIADWVDLEVLGTQICDRQFGIVAKWSLGKFPDTELGDQMRFAVLIILRGVSIGQQATDLDRRLARLNRRLSRSARQS